MRALARALLLLSVSFAASAAGGAELKLGWNTQVIGDSNPLRSADDEEPDASIYGGPNLSFLHRGPSLDARIDYQLRYEQYIEHSSANGFEHFANGFTRWQITPRTTLEVRNTFSRTRGLSGEFLQPIPGIDPIGVAGDLRLERSAVTYVVPTARLTHQLSELWSFEGSLDGALYDSEGERNAPSQSLRGAGQFIRILSPRMLAGGGAAVSRQQFDDTERTVGSGATFLEAFGVFRYQFSPTFSISFSGGPAWNEPDSPEDYSRNPRVGTRPDASEVTRLIDPTRCVLPVSGEVPAGTVSISACPRRNTVFFPPGGGFPVFAPSALISTVAVDPRALSFHRVDRLGDVEDIPGSVTFFGQASLEKQWNHFRSSLFYQRRASTSSGLNSSTNVDVASALLNWTPDRWWSVDLRGTWILQAQNSEQTFSDALLDPNPVTVYVDSSGRVFDAPQPGATAVPNAARIVGVRDAGLIDLGIEIETIRLDLRARRRFGEHLLVSAMTGWWRQTTSGDFREEVTLDNFRVELGLTWTFDPIEL
ncbi:MAG: hypothetical protein OZ948_14675 [Deltaproteobacteria bacterium]|nr:hypothetical protein [Deltaproteobacteria bacterium]